MQNNISSEFQSLAKEEKNYLGKLALQKMSVEDYMNDCEDGHPAVYVGTYAKYNDGSLFGMWVDLVKCGDYDTFISEKDFAEHIVDECYRSAFGRLQGKNLDDMMGHLASYFDYEAYARDLFIDDFYFSNGYVFRR